MKFKNVMENEMENIHHSGIFKSALYLIYSMELGKKMAGAVEDIELSADNTNKTINLLVHTVLNPRILGKKRFHDNLFACLAAVYKNDSGIKVYLEPGERTKYIEETSKKAKRISKEQAYLKLLSLDKENDFTVTSEGETAFIVRYCLNEGVPQRDIESLIFLRDLMRQFPGKNIDEIIEDIPDGARMMVKLNSPLWEGPLQMFTDKMYRKKIGELYSKKLERMFSLN